MLDNLREGLRAAVERLLGSATVNEEAIRAFIQDVQRALLQADVNVKQVLELSKKLEERARDDKLPAGLSRRDHLVKLLYEELAHIMGEEARLNLPYNKLSVILLVGIQGSGKTSAAAKLARYLARRGYRLGMVCADTYRPGALDQLKMLGSVIHVDVYGGDSEAVSVALKGLHHFRDKGKNAIIIDTAGRHKEEAGLIEEMKAIAGAVKPDMTFLVLDATIGQQSYSQANAFHRATPVGGIILTKLDGSAKGGGALAASAATGARIYFVSAGERVDDLEPFSPTRFVSRLLGMGDLQSLLERVRELEAEGEEERARRILAGKMTMDDVFYQMEQLKRMGSIQKVLELIPGLSGLLGGENFDELEEKMGRWRNIIQSMTREEKAKPSVLNSSRIRRIARGAGRTEREVKELLAYHRQAQNLMKAGRGRLLKQWLRRLPPS